MTPADLAITDLTARLHAARTGACAMWLARQAIDLRYERGDFPIQGMDGAVREALALALVREIRERKGE